jgi:predicted GH43/DUF377 family glycosyl hydrolase
MKSSFAIAAAVIMGFVISSSMPAAAGPAATETSYFDGFTDDTGLDPASSTDIELDAMGGVRLKGNGSSAPKTWTTQADFQSSFFYRPSKVVDNPLISLSTLDADATPGSLVLPTSPQAFRRVQDGPVIAASSPASGDGYSVGGMCVRRVELDATYYMWYTGIPENEFTARIYLAKSNDGVVWTRYRKMDAGKEIPVLDIGAPGIFDSRQLGKPTIHYDAAASPKFRMWYTAEGDLTGSIGYATSDDGINWTKWVQPIVTLDGPDDVGEFSSLAIGADGLPVIAYYDATNGDLKFLRCGNAYCSESNTVSTLDGAVDEAGQPSTDDVGRFVDLVVDPDGLPVMAYYDATNGDLKFLRCGNAGCTIGNTIVVVDGSGASGTDTGQYASLAVTSDGSPRIAYYDVTDGDLRFVKCNDPYCADGDDLPVTLDGAGGDVGQYASLAVGPGGVPRIAYYDATGGDLLFIACDDTACAGGNDLPATLDGDAIDAGQHASLAIASSGLPRLAYYDATGGDLKFLACDDTACAGGNDSPVMLDGDAIDAGRYASLKLGVGNAPLIAYYDATNGDLKYLACNDALCAGGDEVPTTADGDPADVGRYASLAIGRDGRPLIAYYDAGDFDLKIAPSKQEPIAVFGPGILGSADAYSVAHPSIIYDQAQSTYRLYYTANDSNNKRVGYATSTDGVEWNRGGIVIDLNNTANDGYGAWAPSVTKDADGYTMVYTGWKPVSGGATIATKLITAESPDGIDWTTGNIGLNPDPGATVSQGSILYDPTGPGEPFKMWYVGNMPDDFGNFHDRIGLSTKAENGSWGKISDVVLGLGAQSPAFDSMSAFDLRPVDDGAGVLYGFYSGINAADFKERIGVATSDDGGLTWTPVLADPADPVIDSGLAGAFDEGGVLTPAPVVNGSEWLVYHTALDAARNPVIALHRVPLDPASGPATRVTTPVLTLGATFDAAGAADPCVLVDGTALTMYYAGIDSSGLWRIGRATGSTAAPASLGSGTLVLAPAAGDDLESGGLRRPVVYKEGGAWHLWYTATGSDGVDRVMHATSANGTAWTRSGPALVPAVAPYDFSEKGAWPSAAWWDDAEGRLKLAFTGIDRFGWRRVGLAASDGEGFIDGATATFQYPSDAAIAGGLPKDWRKITWNPATLPEGTGMEVWVSYFPTFSGLWSNFFKVDNGTNLPFLLTVKGMRWQLRMSGADDAALTPQMDDLAADNAPIAFPATGTAVTIPVGPPPGRYLLSWDGLAVEADLNGGTMSLTVADQDGTPIVGLQDLAIANGSTTVDLAAIPATSGRLTLLFTMTPNTTPTPPESPLLRSVNAGFLSTDVPSSIALSATPNPARVGQEVTIEGLLSSDGTPLAGQSITLRYRLVKATEYTTLPDPATTAADGTFAWPAGTIPTGPTIFRAEWVGGDVGGTAYPAAVGSILVEMQPALPGDFDNDGLVDLTVYYPVNGTWYVKGTAGTNLTKNWGWNATIPVPADYDSDGLNDLAVYYPSNGTWYVKGSAGTNLTKNWGWNATIPVPADWDNDGVVDIAVYYPSNGTWYVKGSAGTNLTKNWGWAATTPVPGDYDGDGILDLAVYYQSNGNWYIKGSLGTNITRSWGWSAAMPVPADWDGDGITDMAVYYPVNGSWYIKGSAGANRTVNWGWNAAWPVPADWDDDGAIDCAVYYATNGTWYIKGSAGENRTQNWGWNGAHPVFLQYQVNKLTGFIR